MLHVSLEVVKLNEDLGIKIGTEEQKFWTDFLEKCKQGLKNAEMEVIINHELIALAVSKIEEEKEKLK